MNNTASNISLPECRWRGEIAGDKCRCRSPKIVNAKVPLATCLICPYADHAPIESTRPAPRKIKSAAPPTKPTGRGPGTELKRLLAGYGAAACQQCSDLARRMDQWGPAGCRDRLDEIVAEIVPRASKWLEQRHAWAMRALGVVGADQAAVRTAVRRVVLRAIEAAEKQPA